MFIFRGWSCAGQSADGKTQWGMNVMLIQGEFSHSSFAFLGCGNTRIPDSRGFSNEDFLGTFEDILWKQNLNLSCLRLSAAMLDINLVTEKVLRKRKLS
jgi:hypothetical protein